MPKVLELGKVEKADDVLKKMDSNYEFFMDVTISLSFFEHGDWGMVSEDDLDANARGIAEGSRIVGRYETCEGNIWITADLARQLTKIFFAEGE